MVWVSRVEKFLLAAVLGIMVLLPLQELVVSGINALARKLGSDFFLPGITGSIPIEQHGTLVLGLLGAALAASQGRLLSLGTLTTFLKGRWKEIANIFSNGFAAAITVLLSVGSLQFVLVEKAASSELIPGIPVWLVELFLPVGFALIAARLVYHSSSKWGGKGATLLLAAILIACGLWLPLDPQLLRIAALVALGIATLLGAPLFTALGGAALILFWTNGEPIANLAIDHYQMAVNPMLPTIPLFTLIGYLLANEKSSARLIRVFHAMVGPLRGGELMLTVLVCAFFTSFTGASGVTILAMGGVLLPVMVAGGFKERTGLGILTGSGSIGLLFPPSIPLILYAIVASTILQSLASAPTLDLGSIDMADLETLDLDAIFESGTSAVAATEVTIESMFLAGLLPGCLLVLMVCLWGRFQDKRTREERPDFNLREVLAAHWEAKWETLIPVVALVSIFGGFATTVQAAAITAFYTFIVEVFIYKNVKFFRELPRIMAECGILVGGVLLILGVAQGFNNYLISEEVPQHLLASVQSTVESPLVFLLLVNLFLLAVGCLMDIYSAIIIVVPMILPMGIAYGIDPVHLGIIFLANLELGFLTPPVGLNLILSAYRFERPILQMALFALPVFLLLLLGVVLITYFPQLTTALPALLK